MAGGPAARVSEPAEFSWASATPDRWRDVEDVFMDCGDGRKCWCAYWYLPNKAFKDGWGTTNRDYLHDLVISGAVPGVLGYVGGDVAAWVSVAPRGQFDRLNRSRSFAPVDEVPVWAVNCFIVKKKFRRKGMMRHMVGAAIEFVRARGGNVLEAYPFESNRKAIPDYDLFAGSGAAFRENGFTEVARRLPSRPIMRLEI
jgi:GNAT superfamily N-acetyltransferase